MIPWYEADDIIYSLVEKFKNDKNLTITILSSDKDLRQFLDWWNIIIIDPQRLKKIDKLEFIKKYWFEPKYIVDWLALVGDSSDNIPWVKWIGEKIATELIKKYKTIENIYHHLDTIPEKIRKKLIEWKEYAFKSKQLIKLLKVPWIENYKLSNFQINIDFDKLKKILIEEKGFKSFEKNLEELKKIYSAKQMSLF
jgi:DNA polymerase-1